MNLPETEYVKVKSVYIQYFLIFFLLINASADYKPTGSSRTSQFSLVFIIDHSLSMLGTGSVFPGNDTYGTRFRVPAAVIDTLSSIFPKAEIGVVVFREKLYFDHRNYQHFVALPGYGDGSYLPLMRLDTAQTGGKTGLEVLHEVLQNDTVVLKNTVLGGFDVECVDLTYKPQFKTVGNTNINCAFAAAKEAMKSSSYPKTNQFFIFLSDGEPHKGENDTVPYAFVSGADCPTTFTVFFDPEEIAPDSLITMRDNIKSNGYSASNYLSDLWAMKADFDGLLRLLTDSVMVIIFDQVNISLPDNNIQQGPALHFSNNQGDGQIIVKYILSESSWNSLDIYSIQGRKVYSFNLGFQPAGSYQKKWNGYTDTGKKVGNGCYIIVLQTQERQIQKSFIISR